MNRRSGRRESKTEIAQVSDFKWRIAERADAEAIAEIYNQGIDDRVATFEVDHRTGDDVRRWIDHDRPLIVVEQDGDIAGYAVAFVYRDRPCYAGVGEFSVYISRDYRGKGIGRVALDGLIAHCRDCGFWKLLSRIFPENEASMALCREAGFRIVGTYERHGRLDGNWRDVIIVEKLIDDTSGDTCGDTKGLNR